MSLRKNKKEIQRLIDAFEVESNKFHDIKFSTFFVTQDEVSDNRKFESPNHAIMLWQYYGKLQAKGGAEGFVNNLQDSELKWGIRGAELTSYAIIEGETCNLFARMAKRAGSLFSEKEATIIKSRVAADIQQSEVDGISIPTAILNDNPMAIWLNYLLYYISMVNPGREKNTRIEPDPFSLSLLALESLLENLTIEKVDKSLKKIEEINFKVALSFPGEKRSYVSKVVDFLRTELGKDQVFYDLDYQSQMARPNLDTLLQDVYREKSGLIVVFLCAEYAQKQWCGLEWRAIRDIIKSKENDKVMFVRFDNADVEGIFSIDGYIDANQFTEEQTSKFIMERVMLLES
jgi:hypothetical protein